MDDGIIREESGHICTLVINRPERANTLNIDALQCLGGIIDEVRVKGQARVLVLRGAGERAFCAGMDLGGAVQGGPERSAQALGYCLQSLANLTIPVVAMVFGPAIGAGLDLTLLADFRLAATNARFGANLVKLGRTYYPAAIHRLIGLVGLAGAKEMLLTGRLIGAERARELNLVNCVYPPEQLVEQTYSLAQELAEENAPLAMKASKVIVGRLFGQPVLTRELEAELLAIVSEVNNSQDAQEGPRAFIEKRKPLFLGR